MRKKICIIASLCIAFGVLWAGTGNGSEKVLAATTIGEIDGSEGITSGDLDALKAHLAGASTLADDALANAEVTGDTDGTGPDVADVVRLKRYLTTPDTTWKEDAKTDPETGETYYEISNMAELLGLAEVTTSATDEIRIVDDIAVNVENAFTYADGKVSGTKGLVKAWTPVANFAGTFAGGEHTISGLYIEGTNAGAGVFNKTSGATIQDIKVENSYLIGSIASGVGVVGTGSGTFTNIYSDMTINGTATSGRGSVGGILGCATGTATVSGCWSDSDITSSVNSRMGGIVGYCNGQQVTISNCLNSGDIAYTGTTSLAYSGGILGVAHFQANDSYDGMGEVAIDNSISLGRVTSCYSETDGTIGGIIGVDGNAAGQDGTYPTVKCSNTYFATHQASSETSVQMASTSGGSSCTSALVRTGIGSGGYAQLSEGMLSYYQTPNLDWRDSEKNADGTWVVQDGGMPMPISLADEAKIVQTEGLLRGEFVIGSHNVGYIPNEELFQSFADKMNAGELQITADTQVKLLVDIDYNTEWDATTKTVPDKAWVPIVGFSGIFDGGNHTIQGLYATTGNTIGDNVAVQGIGLFTQINEATIQNLRVTNSYFTGSTSYGTGIIGQGSGTFRNIYSDVIINVTGGYNTNNTSAGHVGGILGQATGKTIISDCWSNSTISSTRKRIGGIVGYGGNYEVSILHCLNSGNITHTGNGTDYGYAGGILGVATMGSSTGGTVTLQDCLAVGRVESNQTKVTPDATIGGVLGYAGNTSNPPVTWNYTGYLQYTDGTGTTQANKLVGTNQGIAATGAWVQTDLASFQGETAKTKAFLDYYDEATGEGHWVTRESDIPVPKCFAE